MQTAEPEQPEAISIIVQEDGARLDRTLADWRGLSRAAALRLLDRGAVQLNGRVLARGNKGDLLRSGDRLTLLKAFAHGEAPKADASISLDVLHEGSGYLVVNKPAGVPVRPHALDEVGTVINAVAAGFPQVVGVGEGGLRSGVVHRLDTDTSGALLVATEQSAWQRLRDAFSAHRIEKRYIALVCGVPRQQGDACRDLFVTQHHPARVEVKPEGMGGPDAWRCSLGWQVVEAFGSRASMIEVRLDTGFLHQVRAMMNELGHPVIGDPVYGDHDDPCDSPRQMLHAKSLVYEELDVQAPIAADMQQVIDSLRV